MAPCSPTGSGRIIGVSRKLTWRYSNRTAPPGPGRAAKDRRHQHARELREDARPWRTRRGHHAGARARRRRGCLEEQNREAFRSRGRRPEWTGRARGRREQALSTKERGARHQTRRSPSEHCAGGAVATALRSRHLSGPGGRRCLHSSVNHMCVKAITVPVTASHRLTNMLLHPRQLI